MKESKKIAFIGAGNMGEALIRGILASELFPYEDIIASEPREERREEISQELRVNVTSDNREAVRFADIVILSIKPQILNPVLDEISDSLQPNQLLISILAGVSTRRLEEKLREHIPVVRVMPNTPALIQAGVAAICQGRFAREEHLKQVEKILGAVGRVVRLPEEMMNAVTAVSGSGPAYVFLFTEALSEAAQKLGIEKKLADVLAIETVVGAGKLMEETGQYPSVLREKVTSPGGTTEAALKVLKERSFKSIIGEAVQAACRRGEELGQ